MAVAGNSSSEEKHCANIACKGPLTPTRVEKFWKCKWCLKQSCIECNAVHEGENCATYRKRAQQEPLTTAVKKSVEATSSTEDLGRGACGGIAIDGDDGNSEEEARKKAARRETATIGHFMPGTKYFCGADGCTYQTVLHKGSRKFWCPWCHTRHEIEDGVLFKYHQLEQRI